MRSHLALWNSGLGFRFSSLQSQVSGFGVSGGRFMRVEVSEISLIQCGLKSGDDFSHHVARVVSYLPSLVNEDMSYAL